MTDKEMSKKPRVFASAVRMRISRAIGMLRDKLENKEMNSMTTAYQQWSGAWPEEREAELLFKYVAHFHERNIMDVSMEISTLIFYLMLYYTTIVFRQNDFLPQ